MDEHNLTIYFNFCLCIRWPDVNKKRVTSYQFYRIDEHHKNEYVFHFDITIAHRLNLFIQLNFTK